MAPARKSIEERFWAKVDRLSGPCWNWTGATIPAGYGHLKLPGGVGNVYAHRLSYELANGPIPDGMQIDHACFNRRCVNPSHLKAVTVKQNNENRRGARSDSASGVRGVRREGSRHVAYVRHEGTVIWLGTFDTLSEAEDAAIAKRNELFTNNLLDRIPR